MPNSERTTVPGLISCAGHPEHFVVGCERCAIATSDYIEELHDSLPTRGAVSAERELLARIRDSIQDATITVPDVQTWVVEEIQRVLDEEDADCG